MAALPGSSGDDVAIAVRPADAFVDSVGVMIHPDYLDTPYADKRRVLAALRSLGIRHVRAGVQSNPDPKLRELNARHDAFLRRLAANGIRTNLLIDFPGGRRGTLAQSLAVVRERLLGAVETLEGPNEPDLFSGPGWPERTRAFQRALYRAANADPALRRIPVIAPSIGITWHAAALGNVMPWADRGNAHAYPGGYPPGRLEVEGDVDAAQLRARGKPLVVTETGYHNALRDRTDHPPASARAAGAYIPQLLLENFGRGVRRTFVYELIDEFRDPGRDHRESEFGLLRHDFSDKPAARALRNLLALAAGGRARRAARTRARLEFTLSGEAHAARRVALRRRDGSVLLLLWQDASLWDRVARVDLHPPPLSGRLELGRAAAGAPVLALARGARPVVRLDAQGGLDARIPADDVLAVVIAPAR